MTRHPTRSAAETCLFDRFHLLSIDLPGHGCSDKAKDPDKSYTQPAYAEAALEVIEKLSILKVVVFGWSLGGHVAIEMLAMDPEIVQGIMIVGTPPVNKNEVMKGFNFPYDPPYDTDNPIETDDPDAKLPLVARGELDPTQIEDFVEASAQMPYEDWMNETVRTTDPQARSIMFEHFKNGGCCDQRDIVEVNRRPVAVVNGKEDPFVNLKFIKENVKQDLLWQGETLEVEGKHAPFWEDNDTFTALLLVFMDEVTETGPRRSKGFVGKALESFK